MAMAGTTIITATIANTQIGPLWWFVRSRMDPRFLTASISGVLREASGGLPVGHIRTMEELEAANIARQRLNMLLLIAGLLLLWGMVLSQQRSMLREFSRGAVAQEPGPACEIALWVASNISIRGLFFAGVSVGALLQVAFKLSRPY